jgi:uncharacterized membrane protein
MAGRETAGARAKATRNVTAAQRVTRSDTARVSLPTARVRVIARVDERSVKPHRMRASQTEPRRSFGGGGSETKARINSVDLVRGVVMVLMAIDHVRVYSGLPAGGPTAGIFFTRWVTHFCAPAFAFFAGTGAFLYGQRIADRGRLARYLFTRGLLLVVLEPTLIRFTWTFNLHYGQFVLAGVIWMLGWSLIVLAACVRLPTLAIGIAGLAIMFLQQVFRFMPHVGWLYEFVYPTGVETPQNIAVLYTLVPWVGVMMAGYAFGAILLREPAARRRACLGIGLIATVLFIVGSAIVTARRPADNRLPSLFYFLNPPKYPAAPLFLLMTLGPTIALLPLAERARGWIANVFTTFGRVPFFYYLLHIPAIHIAALVVSLVREGRVHPEWYVTAPYTSVPPGSRWSLGLLYLVFAIVVALLYIPCRWYARAKARNPQPWMRYI